MTPSATLSDTDLLSAKSQFAQGIAFDSDAFLADFRAHPDAKDEAAALAAAKAAVSANTKLAKSLTDEEWIAYVRDHEAPEIVRLSEQEMEGLKGGLSFDGGAFTAACVGGAVGGVVGAVAGVIIYAAIKLY